MIGLRVRFLFLNYDLVNICIFLNIGNGGMIFLEKWILILLRQTSVYYPP